MKISTTYQRFADFLDNLTNLEYPERFLGPNWKNVLNFWIYLDTLNDDERILINDRFLVLEYFTRLDAQKSVEIAAYGIIPLRYVYAAFDAPIGLAAGNATYELIGSHKLDTFTFLPLFLNL